MMDHKSVNLQYLSDCTTIPTATLDKNAQVDFFEAFSSELVTSELPMLSEHCPISTVHSLSVGKIISQLLQNSDINLSKKLKKEIIIGGILHYIGKTAISEDLLDDNKTLSESKRKEVQEHAEKGSSLVSDEHPVVQTIIKYHYKFQRGAYPEGEIEYPDGIDDDTKQAIDIGILAIAMSDMLESMYPDTNISTHRYTINGRIRTLGDIVNEIMATVKRHNQCSSFSNEFIESFRKPLLGLLAKSYRHWQNGPDDDNGEYRKIIKDIESLRNHHNKS